MPIWVTVPSGLTIDHVAVPTPSPGGPLLSPPGKQANNTDIEARPDVLTYTTEPFAAAQDLVGPVSARIFVRTDLEHADLFVRVCDVDTRGASRNVVDGIRRLSPQTVPAPDVQVIMVDFSGHTKIAAAAATGEHR